MSGGAQDWSALGREGDALAFLALYRAFDFAIVLMHSLTATGECSCNRLDCTNFAKHAVWRGFLDDPPRWHDMNKEARRGPRNLALRLGDQPSGLRLVALDIDGADGLLGPVVRRFGPLPPTLTERSGRGSHRVFRLPDGVRYPMNSTIAPGVETKSSRGTIVVPPSLHADGHRRCWMVPIEPAELPRALAEAIQRPPERPARIQTVKTASLEGKAYGKRALEAECQTLAQAKTGERNHALNRAAYCVYQLVAGGEIHEGEAVRALFEAARNAGLKDREIKLTLASGAKAGSANPRSAPPREQQARRA